MKDQTSVALSPRNTVFWLSAIAIFLLVAHLITIWMPYIFEGFEHGLVQVLFALFFIDGEGNLPAIYSTLLFLLNAGFFLMVAKAAGRAGDAGRIWLVLSFVFVFLALDESISIHERLIDPLREAWNVTGIFYYAWIIPYGIGVVLLAICTFPIFWRLPKRIRFWFGLSAAIYLLGVIGLEMISGKYLVLMNEKKDIVWILMVTLEETLEMAGLIILAYAQLSLLRHQYNGFFIFVPGCGESSAPAADR